MTKARNEQPNCWRAGYKEGIKCQEQRSKVTLAGVF